MTGLPSTEQPARNGRLVFAPRLWPTVFAVPALAILIGLGTWQLQRLQWKETLIQTLEVRTSAEAVALPDNLAGADLSALEFSRVRVAGRWLPTTPLALLNRTFDGEVGVHQIAAFERTDGTLLLVDRGWMLANGPAADPDPGATSIEGFVRLFRAPGFFVPDNEPARGQWFAMHADEMAAAFGAARVAPVYLAAVPTDDAETYPRASLPAVHLRNDHLQYAITWFGIAAGLIAVFVVFHTRRTDD